METKAIFFLSHISQEQEIALEFKEVIEKTFFGLIDVFVSTSPSSISPGAKWLNAITHSLQSCQIEVILCSPSSVRRPWINFEAGAGWVRGIPVVPICYSGMSPSTLPAPLNELQGVSATDADGLCNLIPLFAKAIGASRPPVVDFQPFVTFVRDFERRQETGSYESDYYYEEETSGSTGPNPEMERRRDKLFSAISGRWRLKYDAGQKNRAGEECLSIDHNGKYSIIHMIHGTATHRFNLHPVNVDDDLEYMTLAKVDAHDGQLWQNEVLTLSPDRSRMQGHSEDDGHRIVYVRF